MISHAAPGKLFIAGEYAVVEPGEPAVLVAVDRFLTVQIAPPDADRDTAPRGPHVAAAVDVVERLRTERGLDERPYGLLIDSDLDDADGRKFGLGSSAAVTIAVVTAVAAHHGLQLSDLERYRLGMLATVQLSPNASGGDLAAATFGGWIRYTAPDRGALAAAAAAGASIGALLRSTAWATSSIEPLPAPTAARLCIGWTGSPASTDRLVGDVRRTHIGSDDAFIAASRSAVDDLVAALRGGDEAGAVAAIRRGRALLRGLGDSHGIAIETDALRTLADIAEANGAAGKASGAGGGDCGIALVPAADGRAGERVAAIHDGWRAAGIRPLDLHVHQPAEVHA